MTDFPARRLKPPPAWRIWDNPIFLRYARSRLRMKGLLPWLLLTVIFSAFIYLIVPISSQRADEFRAGRNAQMRQHVERLIRQARDPATKRKIERDWTERLQLASKPATAEMHIRKTLLPLLAIQALILFVIGTGQVAGGMTSERDEGMVDYQRLAPMTPLAKTLGYLIGLPVREWMMFAATLPFTGLVLWQGKVPFSDWGPVALVFLTSVTLYHLTGLVTGTVFKNRRWSFLLCMTMVFVLYILVPQGAHLGLPFLRYMTMWPELMESSYFLSPDAARNLQVFASHTPGAGVKFFKDDWVFSDLQFTLIVQGSFILTMLVMVWRRWRQADSHLLSKGGALIVFVWLCILPMGNALPAIADGSLFPADTFRGIISGEDKPTLPEAAGMCGFYGLLMLLLLVVLVFLLTPSADTQARGLRRAAKLKRRYAPFLSDASSAFIVVLLLTACAAGSWGWFTHSVLSSSWFNADPGWWIFAAFFGVLAPSTMGLHALLEARGGKWPFLAIVFIGVVPLLAGLVVLVASRGVPDTAMIIGGASPVVQPFYAAVQTGPPVFHDGAFTRLRESGRIALYIWPALYAAGALQGFILLRRHWSRLRKTGGGSA